VTFGVGLADAGEEAQSEVAEAVPAVQEVAPSFQPDPAIVEALVQMGFSENGSKRAAVATQVPLIIPAQHMSYTMGSTQGPSPCRARLPSVIFLRW
jgi:hypothetical protein